MLSYQNECILEHLKPIRFSRMKFNKKRFPIGYFSFKKLYRSAWNIYIIRTTVLIPEINYPCNYPTWTNHVTAVKTGEAKHSEIRRFPRTQLLFSDLHRRPECYHEPTAGLVLDPAFLRFLGFWADLQQGSLAPPRGNSWRQPPPEKKTSGISNCAVKQWLNTLLYEKQNNRHYALWCSNVCRISFTEQFANNLKSRKRKFVLN